MAQFDSRVVGGEVPLNLALVAVGLLLPGGQFGVEAGRLVDAAVQALAGERGQFDLGDVEPGPVAGGVVDLEPLCQRERRLGVEGLIE